MANKEEKIRELQIQVVSMRSELTRTYSKLLKQEFTLFTDRLKNGESILPEKLQTFELIHQPQLEKYSENIMEVPVVSEPQTTVDEIMRKANELRRAKEILRKQK